MLFILEAPGASEDVLGGVAVGPAGILLDKAINAALQTDDWMQQRRIRIGMTNLISCIPKEIIYDEEDPQLYTVGKKIAEPTKEHIAACSERLEEFYHLARPRKVVCVGKLAEKHVPKILDVAIEDTIGIMHPASIMRMNIASRGLEYQRVVVMLEDLFDELKEEGGL